MATSRITDHVEQALARLAQQYKDKPLIAGMIEALADQFQELDDAAWQLATECYLYTDAEIGGGATVYYQAEGEQLDVLGVILGEPRAALTDDGYRLTLRAKVKLNRSSGTAENLVAIFHALEPLALITVQTWPPAYVTLTVSTTVSATESVIYRRFMREGRAAGVQGTLLWQECADANCLILSDAAAYPEIDTNTGLGDVTDPTAGGYLTGAAG